MDASTNDIITSLLDAVRELGLLASIACLTAAVAGWWWPAFGRRMWARERRRRKAEGDRRTFLP